MMADQLRPFAKDGLLNIVGGCCGTTPDHIAAIREACRPFPPRQPPTSVHGDAMVLSGLEQTRFTKLSNFVNIGERCNVAGSRRFCRLIKTDKFDVSCSAELCRKGGLSISTVFKPKTSSRHD